MPIVDAETLQDIRQEHEISPTLKREQEERSAMAKHRAKALTEEFIKRMSALAGEFIGADGKEKDEISAWTSDLWHDVLEPRT
jgi:hypothetical protein